MFHIKITEYSPPLGNTTVFSVDGNGLVTTLVALNFESVKSYLLVVTVTDGGFPQFSTDVTVSVQVTGTNEFTPVFSNSTYSVSHSEVSYSVQSINRLVSQSFNQSISQSNKLVQIHASLPTLHERKIIRDPADRGMPEIIKKVLNVSEFT